MPIVNLSHLQEVENNGTMVSIGPAKIDVTEEFCKINDFIKCHKCKEYFDESTELGQYHPQFDPQKKRVYCETCFNSKYK